MAPCDLRDVCSFFRTFNTSKDPICIGFIRKFCGGDDSARCARKRFLRERKTEAPPDMMPSGRFYRY